MDFLQKLRHFVYFSGVSALLSGCMLGPDFHAPAAPITKRYTETPLPPKTVSVTGAGSAGKSQQFVTNKRIPADWWYLFHSREITRLVEAGLANSPNLAAAKASLRQSEESYHAQVGNLMYPAFGAVGLGQRQRFAGNSIGDLASSSIFNLFNATVNVSYTLDFFGGNRRQLESLKAQVDYAAFQLMAAHLTLTANIVTSAISVASLEEQIRITQKLIHGQETQLNIIQQQYQLGAVSKVNVLSQQTLLEQTRATLPLLQNSLSQALHTLSTLVGDYPSQSLPKIYLEKLRLPDKIPVSMPSNLVKQRPDIGAAQALLHAASAEIGVATANLFPKFNLTANEGWSASTPGSLFQGNNKVWSWGGEIIQPIFQGGSLRATRRAAIAAFDQAMAAYRQSVLQAFQNVADSLRAIETDARNFKANKLSERSAYQNFVLTKAQYRLGGVDYLNLLTAEIQYQQTSLARIQAQAARYADTAALFQALGGGWWNQTHQKDKEKT